MVEVLVCLWFTLLHFFSSMESKRKTLLLHQGSDKLCAHRCAKTTAVGWAPVYFLPPYSWSQADHAIFLRGFLLCALYGSLIN